MDREIMKIDRCFWLYLLECENGTFYTGYTKNLAVRYHQHKNGKQSAKYTRSFKPVRIAQCWRLFDTAGMALKVERFIKKQDRKTKEHWVQNPDILKQTIAKKMNFDLALSSFDTLRVEKESAKLDWKQVRSGFDPFARVPVLETNG
ncbi:hypothetical protein UR09_02325 [Candidatus Nitromaritima sp. SCGC AAA799-A02]|nr:hypothetical protein UR09_02325 [Candidatus Nitromaritima sp. SCGC AAA799-A02]